MTNSAKKILAPVAVTMGCPAGIGPEIICRLFGQGDYTRSRSKHRSRRRRCPAAGRRSPRSTPWRSSRGIPVSQSAEVRLPVVQVGVPWPDPVRWGQPDLATGRAMGRYIEEAVQTRPSRSLQRLDDLSDQQKESAAGWLSVSGPYRNAGCSYPNSQSADDDGRSSPKGGAGHHPCGRSPGQRSPDARGDCGLHCHDQDRPAA